MISPPILTRPSPEYSQSTAVLRTPVDFPNKKNCVFFVMADLQYDIYHLYTKTKSKRNEGVLRNEAGVNPKSFEIAKDIGKIDGHSENDSRLKILQSVTKEKYDIAYIPNIKTSVFMNNIFRNIRENKNIDYIEESDDEDNFENTAEDKYVDLKKVVIMECSFHNKFKKWVPFKVLSDNQQHRVLSSSSG